MKILLFLFGLALTITCSLKSQTLVWKVHTEGKCAIQDGQGNTYTARGYSSNNLPPDSLTKIDSLGATIWTVAIPSDAHYYQILLSNAGIYVVPQRFDTPGILYHFGTDGTLEWHYQFPEHSEMKDFARTDQEGNLVFTYTIGDINYPPITSKLIKLKADGSTVYDVTIPTIAPGERDEAILGPAIADNGTIWILGQATVEHFQQLKSRTSYKVIGFERAMLFDGTSGALLLQKDIFQGLVEESIDDGRGNTKDFTYNNGGYAASTLFLTSNDNSLVAGGYSDVTTTRCRSNGSCTSTQKSEWRMTIVDPTGKRNTFRYRGKGAYRASENRTRASGDNYGNELKEIFAASNGILYLHGNIAQGKSLGDPSALHMDDLLLRYNMRTKRVEWKLLTRGPTDETDIGTYLYEPSQILLRQRDNKTIDSYDASGGTGATPLVFPDNVILPSEFDAYSIHNKETGALIIRGDDSSGLFIGKYSIGSVLANRQFVQQPAPSDDGTPFEYSLSQNYPNPFNPTTSIEFDLARDAAVTVKVYDALGQEMTTVSQHEEFSEGPNELDFNASGLPSGVYFCRLLVQDLETDRVLFTSVKKMMLIK